MAVLVAVVTGDCV